MTELSALQEDPRLIRVFLESPLLEERKRAKLPSLRFDALLVDFEDSVPPHRKREVREVARQILSAPAEERLHGMLIPRVNPIGSGFFEEDIAALADLDITHIAYPMLQDVEELDAALEKMSAIGIQPKIFASIETARGVQNVDAIAAHPSVCALLFGPSDLGLDMGIPLAAAKDITGPALYYQRARVITAAAANEIAAISMAFPARLKDLEQVREHVIHGRNLGLTGMMAFYPPHLEIIDDAFTPSTGQVEKARESVEVYESAAAQGRAQAYLADGELVLAFDYEQSKEVLRKHGLFERGN
ncbi:aldolase/citrate lyase family protein [Citricoccus sp. NPDC055426]|uniref:HpcH/HpaI aldolase/citrate lyase family protein n=1 Tax=Citricoccus sp. NPDC055426 TaxID=3155536 RepID=UPI00342BDC09